MTSNNQPQEDNTQKETLNKAKEAIFELAKDVPNLTDIQLNEKYSSLTGKQPPETTKEWIRKAVIRLIQRKYYTDNGIEVPVEVIENDKKFFDSETPNKNKKKTPKYKRAIDRKKLNQERINLLRNTTLFASSLVPDPGVKFHPQNKYATVKSGKSVVMYIEKKLRKIIVHMGGERDRKTSPKINVFVGTEEAEMKEVVTKFVSENINNYMDRRDKRWEKCKDILAKIIDQFKNKIEECKEVHAHPSGRYTTFKDGRLVLVFITQDRSKGEISFHPGGERDGKPEITTTVKVKDIKNDSDISAIVDKFLATKYAKYIEKKTSSVKRNKTEMKKMLEICSSSIPSDHIFQHPRDFFGLVKNGDRTLLMIKRVKRKAGEYSIVAWVKKQKNNPSIKVNISWEESEIKEAVSTLYNAHLA